MKEGEGIHWWSAQLHVTDRGNGLDGRNRIPPTEGLTAKGKEQRGGITWPPAKSPADGSAIQGSRCWPPPINEPFPEFATNSEGGGSNVSAFR